MPTDVVMPQMGESIFEGTITKWLKKPGDTVQRDEPLFEISTDKVDAEIPSPASGTLSEIKVDAGNTVQINTVVAVIGEGDGAVASKPAAAAPAPAKQEAPKEPQKPEPPKAAPAPAAPVEAAASSGGGTDVVMPQMGESIFEGTITKWLKKVGDSVQRDEPLFEISTDKVDAEIPSPASGTLSEIKVDAGNTVQINTVVAVIGGGAAKASAPAAADSTGSRASACRDSSSGARSRSRRGGVARRAPALVPAGAQDCEGASGRSAAGPRHGLDRPHHQGRHPAICREGRRC